MICYLALLISLCFLATFITITQISKKHLTQATAINLQQLSVTIGSGVEAFIRERKIDAVSIAQSHALESNKLPEIINYLSELVELNANIIDADFLDLNVRFIFGFPL